MAAKHASKFDGKDRKNISTNPPGKAIYIVSLIAHIAAVKSVVAAVIAIIPAAIIAIRFATYCANAATNDVKSVPKAIAIPPIYATPDDAAR